MEMLRRQFIEALVKFGGAKLFGDVSLALVSSPVVAPDEYLKQCSVILDACWQWLNRGDYRMVERALNAHVPTLDRFANTISPYQEFAASRAVEAKIMQILLATRSLQFREREGYCVDAIRFGELSGDRNLHAIAQYWLGNTFTYCYHQPQRAISLLNDTLSGLDSDTSLIRCAIYSELSFAHAQDNNNTNFRHNEKLSQDYMEKARSTMPKYPELDPFYRSIDMGLSELDQIEGKVYLYLAEHFSDGGCAKRAYTTFERSSSKPALSQSYQSGLLTKKADAARALGDMDECVTCLTNGLRIGVEIGNLKRISEAHDVMHRMPEAWQRETTIQELQKDISHAIVVAHQ
jgi:hypothetical protein